jgi:hypothetical protein
MEREEFVKLVEEALAALPARFRKRIQNVAVLVENAPPEQLSRRGSRDAGIISSDDAENLVLGGRAARVLTIEQFGKWKDSKLERSARIGSTMPVDSHHKAAEYHELAAHAHRAAAAHHGKEDHQTGHEHSKQALEYSNKASQWSQEAHRKSEKSTGKP